VVAMAPIPRLDVQSEIVEAIRRRRRVNHGVVSILSSTSFELAGAIPEFLAGCSWEIISSLRGFVLMTKGANPDYAVTAGTKGSDFCSRVAKVLGEMLIVLKKDLSDHASKNVFAQVSELALQGWFGWFFVTLPNIKSMHDIRDAADFLSSSSWTPEKAKELVARWEIPSIPELASRYEASLVAAVAASKKPTEPEAVESAAEVKAVIVPKPRPITLVREAMRRVFGGVSIEDDHIRRILEAAPDFIDLTKFDDSRVEKLAQEAVRGFMVRALSKDSSNVVGLAIVNALKLSGDEVRLLIDEYREETSRATASVAKKKYGDERSASIKLPKQDPKKGGKKGKGEESSGRRGHRDGGGKRK